MLFLGRIRFIFWGLSLALASAAISQQLRNNPKYLEWLNKGTGTLLVGLGVRLALEKA